MTEADRKREIEHHLASAAAVRQSALDHEAAARALGWVKPAEPVTDNSSPLRCTGGCKWPVCTCPETTALPPSAPQDQIIHLADASLTITVPPNAPAMTVIVRQAGSPAPEEPDAPTTDPLHAAREAFLNLIANGKLDEDVDGDTDTDGRTRAYVNYRLTSSGVDDLTDLIKALGIPIRYDEMPAAAIDRAVEASIIPLKPLEVK